MLVTQNVNNKIKLKYQMRSSNKIGQENSLLKTLSLTFHWHNHRFCSRKGRRINCFNNKMSLDSPINKQSLLMKRVSYILSHVPQKRYLLIVKSRFKEFLQRMKSFLPQPCGALEKGSSSFSSSCFATVSKLDTYFIYWMSR